MKTNRHDTLVEIEKTCLILVQVNSALATINRKLPRMERASLTITGRKNQTTEHKTRILNGAAAKLDTLAQQMSVKNAQMQLPLHF